LSEPLASRGADALLSNPPAVERWKAPVVEGPIVGRRADGRTELDKNARQASHSHGYQAGLDAAKAETQARTRELDLRIARLDAILKQLSRPLEELDVELEKQLTALVLTIGKQIVRRELKTDPEQVIAILRESVSRLPASARDVRVHLHPEDAAIVRQLLATPSNDRAWSMVEDPALTRGGCLVRTDTSQIDARLESRLNAIVSAALGDERTPARGATDAPETAAE
jgi:flagellar assembly protein FliH